METAAVAVAAPREVSKPDRVDVRQVVLGMAVIGGGIIAMFAVLPTSLALLVALPLVCVWVWQAPVRGVYVLLAGAAMIEIFPLGFPDSLTDRVPLFTNLNNSVGLGVPITPAEILMVVTAAAVFTRSSSEHRVQWPRGRLFNAYLAYLVVVLFAEVHGLLGGGDFKTSLWEMRPQAYGFILFVLTATLVQQRVQLERLTLIFLFATFVKGVVGGYRYFFTLHGALGSGLEVLAHEDSYFLALFMTATLAALIWIKDRRLVTLMSIGSILCLIAMLANSRRAGVYAAAGAVAVVLLLAYKFEPSLRKPIAWVTILVVVAGAAFVASAWNKEYGIQAQLVRPIRSLVDPSARDFSSDLYRTAETANLLFTFHTSPVVGVGFGSPFDIVYPMADISNVYPLWNVIPHNSLLWIGMRMGTLGFITFWGVIGLAVLAGFEVIRSGRDPFVRAVTATVLGAIAAEIAVGYTDLQLENYRNLIFIGAALGVLYILQRREEEAT
jgi:O-antigen ligase